MKLNRELIMRIWERKGSRWDPPQQIKPARHQPNKRWNTNCAPDPPVKPSVAPEQTKWGWIACSQIWRKHLPPAAREQQNDSTRQNDLNFLPKKTLLMKWCVLRGDGPSALAPPFIKRNFLSASVCGWLELNIHLQPALHHCTAAQFASGCGRRAEHLWQQQQTASRLVRTSQKCESDNSPNPLRTLKAAQQFRDQPSSAL